ncbi:hypothetical protein [Streptomyces sp. NPDC059909]
MRRPVVHAVTIAPAWYALLAAALISDRPDRPVPSSSDYRPHCWSRWL